MVAIIGDGDKAVARDDGRTEMVVARRLVVWVMEVVWVVGNGRSRSNCLIIPKPRIRNSLFKRGIISCWGDGMTRIVGERLLLRWVIRAVNNSSGQWPEPLMTMELLCKISRRVCRVRRLGVDVVRGVVRLGIGGGDVGGRETRKVSCC